MGCARSDVARGFVGCDGSFLSVFKVFALFCDMTFFVITGPNLMLELPVRLLLSMFKLAMCRSMSNICRPLFGASKSSNCEKMSISSKYSKQRRQHKY